MTEQDLVAFIAALFEHQWTIVLTLAMPIGIWIYRNYKRLSQIDTVAEWKLVLTPVAVVAAAGFGAQLDWQTIVTASVVKLFVGLGLNGAPVLPVRAPEEQTSA